MQTKNHTASFPAVKSHHWRRLCLFSHFGMAFAAVNRATFTRLEQYPCFAAAGIANCSKHFAFRSCVSTLCITASLAALRLIHKASLCEKFLLSGSENKFRAAVLAYQCLVFVHSVTLPFPKCFHFWDSSCQLCRQFPFHCSKRVL